MKIGVLPILKVSYRDFYRIELSKTNFSIFKKKFCGGRQ